MENLASIPKINPQELCEAWKLCSVREKNWEYMVALKQSDSAIKEIPLKDIVDADSYNWLSIKRVYSSWHCFIDDSKQKVFLVTTDKNWKIQHQFTWWSPHEKEFSDIIFKDDDGKIKIDLFKSKKNAITRTFLRTWAQVKEHYNDLPLVDWVMMEITENWENYYKLVLLLHYIVKKYEGILWFNKWVEDVIDGKWYEISSLNSTPNISANASIVCKKALELIK